MPTKLIKATTGTAADKNKAIESMTVKLSKGEAEFDASALSAISSQADSKNITMRSPSPKTSGAPQRSYMRVPSAFAVRIASH